MLTRDRGLSAILLAIGVGWGAGNVGPVVTPLGQAFHVSLAGIGLLSGTVYFARLELGAAAQQTRRRRDFEPAVRLYTRSARGCSSVG